MLDNVDVALLYIFTGTLRVKELFHQLSPDNFPTSNHPLEVEVETCSLNEAVEVANTSLATKMFILNLIEEEVERMVVVELSRPMDAAGWMLSWLVKNW
jgi:hypothetical protein